MVAVALLAWLLEVAGKRVAAVLTVAAGAALGIGYFEERRDSGIGP